MISRLEILIAGESEALVRQVAHALEGQPMTSVEACLIENGLLLWEHAGLRKAPDAVILCIDGDWNEHYDLIVEQQLPLPRPLLFAVAVRPDIQLLRAAMRVGVRDTFELPLNVERVLEEIRLLLDKVRAFRPEESGCRLTTFMNTKGGSGASLIAANVAVALKTNKGGKGERRGRLLLVDFDFQFGGLPIYLNMGPSDGLLKALEFVDTLDETALLGYVQKHESGLHLLSAVMEEIILLEDVGAERTSMLLSVIGKTYDSVLIDVPRRVDGAVATMIERSDMVVLITQQTVSHLHDAKRLFVLLRDRMAVAADRLLVVVNRYDSKADVRLDDFAAAFPNVRLEILPGDYVRASESINLGVPICENAPNSPLGQALRNLAERLHAAPTALAATKLEEPKKPAGLFGWLLGR